MTRQTSGVMTSGVVSDMMNLRRSQRRSSVVSEGCGSDSGR